jgi:two-component system phosphate regulon response regulator OmpR
MPVVAIVEDEDDLREAVAEYLSERGLDVRAAGSAKEFREMVAQETVDVAVLDIAMAGESGLSLARWLMTTARPPALIFATAAGRPVDRVAGLEIGADDYLVKPYELRELLARIRSVLRRSGRDGAAPPAAAAPAAPEPIRIGAFRLDPASGRLSREGGPAVLLTPAEFGLLQALAQRPNRVLSRDQLLDLAPAHEGNDSARSIDVRITRLRRKLEADPENPTLIRTIRGEGYMFVPSGA